MANSEQFLELKALSNDLIAKGIEFKLFTVVVVIDATDDKMMMAASHRGDDFYRALKMALQAFERGEASGMTVDDNFGKQAN